jgi:hypothetical protein
VPIQPMDGYQLVTFVSLSGEFRDKVGSPDCT